MKNPVSAIHIYPEISKDNATISSFELKYLKFGILMSFQKAKKKQFKTVTWQHR